MSSMKPQITTSPTPIYEPDAQGSRRSRVTLSSPNREGTGEREGQEDQENQDRPVLTLKHQGTTTEVPAYQPDQLNDSEMRSEQISGQLSEADSPLEQVSESALSDISEEDLVFRSRLFALMLCLIALYLTYDALTTLDPFQLRRVVFTGQRRVTAHSLAETLNLDELRPSWLTPHLSELESAAMGHSWIKSAEASLDYWSGEITVEVQEHKPRGVIMLDDLYAVTADGIPFAIVTPQEAEGLPLISGLTPDTFKSSPEDQLIGQYWISRAIKLATYINMSKLLDHGRQLSEVHIAPTGRFEVMLNHIRIILGADLLRDRVLEVERILAHLDSRGVTAAYILLSDDLNRAIIREIPRADRSPAR